ncbi:MAG: phenylalanine--tRNA ligase subunit beta, partial [Oscillospiraceae bacterium]|nr:phenylalanine--tRNA ligase subunit beta [Oscillospiraceae bacterium]
MNLSYEWLKSFVDINVSPREFANRMTMTGSKVEGWSREADGVKNVVTGRVLEIERHPDSDHLWICRVDAGGERPLQIVTGAQNLKGGELCPVALDGSELPGGAKIKTGKLRGALSEGMLCSLSELGFTAHDFPGCVEDGIMTLPEGTPVGEDIARVLGMEDEVFEFEITPNRPDCLSVRGLAREAAVSFNKELKCPEAEMPEARGDILKLLRVKNEAPDICLRYTGAVVENVRVKPSPEWLRQRLRRSGVRPINNIVDITNYVMLEYGQPMHAFDLRHVKDGTIIVRRAKEGESIETLDGVTRQLTPEMMVIADSEKPSAIAGIMGGEYSSITDSTTSIVFESACFDGVNVRTTARALGMRTESSARFEKGLDPCNTEPALIRALELVAQLDAGDVVKGLADAKGEMPEMPLIPLDPQRINAFLGTDISEGFMVETLKRLGCEVDGKLNVRPPSWRADVEGFADLSEEVARFYGYENIPSTVMIGIAAARPTDRQRLEKKLANTLAGCGMWEINTYSFMSARQLDALGLPQDDARRKAVVISNPFGEDSSLMRTTALPGLLETLARNYKARVSEARLFECATVFEPDEDEANLPHERRVLIGGGYGEDFDFFALKGLADAALRCYNIKDAGFLPLEDEPGFHPTRTARVLSKGRQLGILGELKASVAENYGIKTRVCVLELDMELLFEMRGELPRFKRLPRFPAVTRDLALVCELGKPSAQIEEIIRESCGALLETLKVFD